MNNMMFLQTRIIDGRVCALNYVSMRWVPISAIDLAVNGCLFRLGRW